MFEGYDRQPFANATLHQDWKSEFLFWHKPDGNKSAEQ
jgi:hypothetical protein